MTVLDDLLDGLEQDAVVRHVLIGEHWIAVCSRHCGLASTLGRDWIESHGGTTPVDSQLLNTARGLAQLARSDNLLEASIGVAAINSLIDVDETRVAEVNALHILTEEGLGKIVAVVGRFPFIPQLRDIAARLWIIEKEPQRGEFPSTASPQLLPQADVIAITGTTLINHTLDDLLKHCRPRATVVVLGGSTPLSSILFEHGVTVISGARVVAEGAALRSIARGARFPELEGLRLLTMRSSSLL